LDVKERERKGKEFIKIIVDAENIDPYKR